MRGVRISNAFKSYLKEQSYNWPVGNKSTDFDDAYVRDIYVTDTKLHNLKLIGKFFKTEDDETASEAYRELLRKDGKLYERLSDHIGTQ